MLAEPTRYYQESGKVDFNSVIGTLLIVLTVSSAVGWVYGYLSYYYPFPVYSVFIVIGYAAVVGYSMYLCVKLFKIRNQKYVSKLSIGLGLAAYYIGWIWFMSVDQDRYIIDPISIIKAVSQHEIWWGAYIAWILELILILVVMWFSVTTENVEPFCEACNKWIKPNPVVPNLEPIDQKVLLEELENHTYDYLMNLRKINDTAHKQSRVKIYCCTTCGEENYLTVEDVRVVVQSNNKPKEDYCNSIVGNIKVKHRDIDLLKEWGKVYNEK